MMELQINRIMEKCKQLNHLQENPFLYRIMTLKMLVSLFSIKGYCSVIWLNRWFSEKDENNREGKVYSFYHTGNPQFFLRKAWEIHIKSGNSIIEQAIWEKYKGKECGFATAQEVLEKKSLFMNVVGWLAKSARLGEMGYLWIRPNNKDFWIFCLRKKRYEIPFTESERQKILLIGQELLSFRKTWHKKFNIGLTERQLIIYDLRCQGLTDVEIGQKLNVSEHTIGKEIINILDLKGEEQNTRITGAFAIDNALNNENSLDFLLPKEMPQILNKTLSHKDWKIIRTLALSPLKKRNDIAEELKVSVNNLNVQISRINKKLNTDNQQKNNNYMKSVVKILSLLNEDVDFYS